MMSALPLWKPATHTLRPFVPAIGENERPDPDGLLQFTNPSPPFAVAGASSLSDSELPMPTVSEGGMVTVAGLVLIAPEQPAVVCSVSVIAAVPPTTATLTLPSVKEASATEPETPLARTLYSATNQSG